MAAKKTMSAQEILIQVGNATLGALLTVPFDARGIILFAHGSGSSRFSPRNQFVSQYLHDENCATLLMDLLTPQEEAIDNETRELRFNIPFLAERLLGVTDWLNTQAEVRHLPIGYFGASTGAAAALIAASEKGDFIKAIVSRGGRPDLASHSLAKVVSPTLLIVGENDFGVVELNEKALEMMHCKKKLEIIPGATHLFEEPGTLERAAHAAALWFSAHL